MCQLGVDQVPVPNAPTREDARAPNNRHIESGTGTTITFPDNHVRVCDLHSLDKPPRAGLVHHNSCTLADPETSLLMATPGDTLQRPKFQYSQSFRQQSTQDALAEVPPSARPSDANAPKGDVTITPGLDGASKQGQNAGTISLSEENLQHRLNASGSVQAIVVDDDVLFAGLQGGDIVVSMNLSLITMRHADQS